MSKYRIKACPQMSYDLVFHSKQGSIFTNHILKIPKSWRNKSTFDLSKFKFQNRLQPKTYIFGSFSRQTALLQTIPKKIHIRETPTLLNVRIIASCQNTKQNIWVRLGTPVFKALCELVKKYMNITEILALEGVGDPSKMVV